MNDNNLFLLDDLLVVAIKEIITNGMATSNLPQTIKDWTAGKLLAALPDKIVKKLLLMLLDNRDLKNWIGLKETPTDFHSSQILLVFEDQTQSLKKLDVNSKLSHEKTVLFNGNTSHLKNPDGSINLKVKNDKLAEEILRARMEAAGQTYDESILKPEIKSPEVFQHPLVSDKEPVFNDTQYDLFADEIVSYIPDKLNLKKPEPIRAPKLTTPKISDSPLATASFDQDPTNDSFDPIDPIENGYTSGSDNEPPKKLPKFSEKKTLADGRIYTWYQPKPIPCELCDCTGRDKFAIFIHYQNRHPEFWNQADNERRIRADLHGEYRKKIFYDEDGNIRNKKGPNKNSNNVFQCELCEHTAPHKYRFFEHIRTKHFQYWGENALKLKQKYKNIAKDGESLEEGRKKFKPDSQKPNEVWLREECTEVIWDESTQSHHCVCGKVWPKGDRSHASQIKKHVDLVHRNVAPKRDFACHLCDKKFRENRALQEHLDVHNDIKRHVCEFCQQAFRKKTRLQGHMRKQHPAEDQIQRENKIVENALKRRRKKESIEAQRVAALQEKHNAYMNDPGALARLRRQKKEARLAKTAT